MATLPLLITPNGFFNPFQKFLFEETELGNLAEPLSIQHVIADRIEVAVTAEGTRSLSAATALSAIERFFVDGPSIDALRRVLGLTSSGAVRLVDSLETQGLVTRRRGDDPRVSVILLTAKGRRVAGRGHRRPRQF